MTTIETKVLHSGRTLKERRERHKQATDHNRWTAVKVRKDKKNVGNVVFQSETYYLYQECTDCKKAKKE